MNKTEILAKIKAEKVIALIRADSPASLLDCARALSAGGLNCLELTMTTPGALELCAQVSRELPHILLGLGTVLDAAYALHPERFVNQPPRPGVLPPAVWINPPKTTSSDPIQDTGPTNTSEVRH